MAGMIIHMPSGEVSLVAATVKTVIEATAAANHRFKLLGLEVFGKGVSTTDTPILVSLVRKTAAGTGTAGTEVKNDPDDAGTIQTSFVANNTVEGTIGDVLKNWEVHPQTGLIVYFPLGQEVIVPTAGIVAVRCTAAQAQTVSVNLIAEE